MEITRHVLFLLFILLVHLSALYCHANLTSVKKTEKAFIKPHGRHVANKRGRSTLFDPHSGNGTLPNVSPVAVVSIKGSPQQQESIIKSVYPIEKLRDEKKKRKKKKKHMKKKWRDEMNSASLVGYRKSHPKRKCRNWGQCKQDECCIRHSSTKGFCKKRPQKGDRCKPILLPGLRDCPCGQGLTCTRYKTTKWGIKKHRCEHLKLWDDEIDQRYV